MKLFNLKALATSLLAALVILAACFFYFRGNVTIIADGKETRCRSLNIPVGDFLNTYGIAVSSMDIVVPSLETPTPKRGTIRVTRVLVKNETVTEVFPFIIRWSQKSSRNLRPVELQKGSQRKKFKLVKNTYHDGKIVSTDILRERTTKNVFYRLVLLNQNGSWECIYDLSRSKRIRMLATAYYPGDPLAWRDGTETYLGEKMQRGIVAVDPKVISLKTRVYVSGYGYGWAGDTGSAIKRKRIDLGVNNKEEEKDYMHVPVNVYILEKAEGW